MIKLYSFVVSALCVAPALADEKPSSAVYASDFQKARVVSAKSLLTDMTQRAISVKAGDIIYGTKLTRRMEYSSQGDARTPILAQAPKRRKGDKALWLEVVPSTKISRRSEYKITSSIFVNQEYHIGMDIFVPAHVSYPDTWTLLAQCPQGYGTPLAQKKKPAISPALALHLGSNGGLKIVTQGGSMFAPKRVHRTSNGRTGQEQSDIVLDRDRWHRVVLGFKMGKKGHVKLWLNGEEQKVVMPYGQIGYNEATNFCPIKFGIYSGGSQKSLRLLFDNVKVAKTYGDVH